MRNVLLPALTALAAAATTACFDTAPQPVAVDTDALIAPSWAWTPSDITRDASGAKTPR
jgi:hypothetical protein